jgi:DHA1 family multidrug resistance protein-like MFS transporter
MSSATTGILISLLVVTSAVLSFPVGALADKANKRLLVFIGGAITLAAIWSLYLTNSNTGLFVVIIFFGIGGGVLTTVVTSMSAVIGKSLNSTGSVMSLLMAGHSAGMFTGPLLSGWVMDFAGSINKAFEISGVILLISLILAWFLTRNYKEFEASSYHRIN